MIDCFAMFSSTPLHLFPPGARSSVSPDSRPFVADGFRKPYRGEAKINGHSVRLKKKRQRSKNGNTIRSKHLASLFKFLSL